MTTSPQQKPPNSYDPSEDSHQANHAPRPEISSKRYTSHVINVDRRFPGDTVFHIDENIFTPTLPRTSHWSIAWSDLMMTMFVLFLSMYVYKSANQEFLHHKTPEIIGGDTTEALQSTESSGATFPFAPIAPGLPLMSAGTVKKVEEIEIDSLDPESVYPAAPLPLPTTISEQEEKQQPVLKGESSDPFISNKETSDSMPETVKPSPLPTPSDTLLQPSPLELEPVKPAATDQFQEIYTLSKDALKNNKLDNFASIDIVPDKTMRIILTGDLLFAIGESELSLEAKASLQKVAEVIQQTPYMINIVGHTDNLPMRSNRFKSNWELSVARASTVARFLIDGMNMNPNQFVVSGYSSYRPVVANTTAENRAKNRRVEIIISKRLPKPLPATEQNLR